jgi:hypothetical protein
MAPGVAGAEVAGTGVKVVGHQEGGVGMPQAVHGHLPSGAAVPTEGRGLVPIADVWVAALGESEHHATPGRGWEGMQATSEGRAPAPQRSKPDPARLNP